MAPAKRRQSGSATASPKKRKRGADGSTQSASTSRRRKVEWRLLPQDVVQPKNLDFDVVSEDDFDENDAHTAHCDAVLRPSGLTESMQQGAASAGLVEDVVAINDVFTAQVEAATDKLELGVVRELEAGAVPEEVLPAAVSTLLRSGDDLQQTEETCEEDESVITSKLEATKELKGLYSAYAAQQEAEDAEDELREGADEVAGIQQLCLGTTFPSLQVADHMVRLKSPIKMLIVPGTSTRCKVWCCHSNKRTHNASGTRRAKSDDGSRATSHHSGGCPALFQVHSH
jgi:hypothetical protein